MTDKILWPDTPFKLDEHLILVGRRGSEAHGTYIPSENPTSVDDRDLMGIVVPPAKYYIGLSKWEHAETIKECWDVVLYEYRKFIGLLLNQNPNVLGMLWLEEEDYLLTSKQSKVLIANRNLFRERRKAASSFMGYATSQLYKMEHMAFKGYMGDKRKKLVEKHGYDSKNAGHLIRLLHMGIEFLTTGELHVRRTWDRDMLIDIKKGKWSLDEVKKYAQDRMEACKEAELKSDLPEQIDTEAVEAIVLDTISEIIR